MITKLLLTLIIKVFVFVLTGVAINRIAGCRGERITRYFVNISLYLIIPVFVLLSLWTNPVSMGLAWKVIIAAIAVIGIGSILAFFWARFNNIPFSRQCLPIIFMNSAYLAIPVNTLLWGSEGTAYAIIYNMVITLAHFTVGVWWVNAEKSFHEIMGLPVLYAIVAGVGLNLLSVNPTPLVFAVNDIFSVLTLPVMLIFLGYRLACIKLSRIGSATAGVALRMAGGGIAGWIIVYLLDIKGPAAGVCVISSSMPAAVNSYILAERFHADAEFAAAAVFLGTVVSFFSIPLVSYFLGGIQ